MGSGFRLDPRVFIGPPFYTCPKCSKPALGTLMFGRRVVNRRCRECGHTESERLPELHKRLVYLDQFAYSNMAKALDPVWAAQRPPQAPFWTELFDVVDRSMKLQLIVCPHSTVHEKESSVSAHPEVLRTLYEHLSAGVSFRYPQQILCAQWAYGLDVWLRGKLPDYGSLPPEGVLNRSPHEWLETIRISVNMPGAGPDATTGREVRSRSYAAMGQWHLHWQGEEMGFEDWYRFERGGNAFTVWELYKEHQALLAKAIRGEIPMNTEDLWNPRLEVGTIQALVRVAERHENTPKDVLAAVGDFLNSRSAQDAPANDIGAMMMAALARKARAGQKRLPSPGMWNDITAIAHFLPYCDAMFVDNECAGLLAEEPLRSRVPGTDRVYCLNTKERFLAFLDGLEQEAGADHRDRVVRAYGENWLVPYREVLADERRRRRPPDTDAGAKAGVQKSASSGTMAADASPEGGVPRPLTEGAEGK